MADGIPFDAATCGRILEELVSAGTSLRMRVLVEGSVRTLGAEVLLRVAGGRFIDARSGSLVGVHALELLALAKRGQIHPEPDPNPPGAIQRYPGFSVAWRDAQQRVERLVSLLAPLGGLDGVLIADLDRLVSEAKQLPEAASQVLGLVDGARTVAEILSAAQTDSLLTARIMRRLMGARVLQLSAPVEELEPSQPPSKLDLSKTGPSESSQLPSRRPKLPPRSASQVGAFPMSSPLPGEFEVGGEAVEHEIRRWLSDEEAPDLLLSDQAFSTAFSAANDPAVDPEPSEVSGSSVTGRPTDIGAPSEEALAELAEPSSPDLPRASTLPPRGPTLTREVRTVSARIPGARRGPSPEPEPQLDAPELFEPETTRSDRLSSDPEPAELDPPPETEGKVTSNRPGAFDPTDQPVERVRRVRQVQPVERVERVERVEPLDPSGSLVPLGPSDPEDWSEESYPERSRTGLVKPDDDDAFIKEAGVGGGPPAWQLALGVAVLGLLLGTLLFFWSKEKPKPQPPADLGTLTSTTVVPTTTMAATGTASTATVAETSDAGVSDLGTGPEGRPLIAGPDAPEDVREAEALLNSENYRAAAKLLAQLRRTRSNDAAVWILSGQLAVERGQLSNAQVWADRALSIDGRNFRAWVLKGSVLQFRQRYKAAKRAYNRGLSIAPNHPMAQEIRMVVQQINR